MIVDHYLTVRQWQSNFHPKIASIDKVLIWIRIPNLPIEYYDKNFLLRLGSCIGRPIKVDEATLQVARGKYARIYVEVDLSQPCYRNSVYVVELAELSMKAFILSASLVVVMVTAWIIVLLIETLLVGIWPLTKTR